MIAKLMRGAGTVRLLQAAGRSAMRRGSLVRVVLPQTAFLRSFFSWGASPKKAAEPSVADRLVEAAARDMSPAPPGAMLESPNPVLKQLAEQYAQAKCGFCKESPAGGTLQYSCPQSGFPSHCSEQCYQQDKAHHANAEDLVSFKVLAGSMPARDMCPRAYAPRTSHLAPHTSQTW